jgi:hypothetical protein
MKAILRSLLVLSSLAFPLVAHGIDETDSEIPSPGSCSGGNGRPLRHSTKRAIAFGSVLMQAHGSNVSDWKAIDAFVLCLEEGGGSSKPRPEPKPPRPSSFQAELNLSPDEPPVPDGPQPRNCSSDVSFTTHYEMTECPNGEVYVTRSGEGISLTSPTTGDFYNWIEMVACHDGPFKGPASRNDKDRPLDPKNIVKTFR